MQNIDKKTQKIIVEKVLEEMQKAEEYVKSWKASWYEQLLDAHCLSLNDEISEADVRDMERKYESRYKLANAFYFEDSTDIPLAKETLAGNNTLTGEKNINYECEFGRIDWYGMTSHKSEKYFSFNNNGKINYSKFVKRRLTPKNPRKISYDASFNVLSNNFSIDITLSKLIQDSKEKFIYDNISVDLAGNILTKKFNDIEIIEDLDTGIKIVRIIKNYDKENEQNNVSIAFDACLNPDGSLDRGAISINIHKANGKINGTYRLDVNRKNGIHADFYSRKGVKVDLLKNPMLLETANNLLLSVSDNQNVDDIIALNFVHSTLNIIAKNSDQKVIKFDSSDFNMETVKQTDVMVIEMLKTIKGELPLSGLVERINKCLKKINKLRKEVNGTTKTLKLEPKK